jgi:hypothetical protein
VNSTVATTLEVSNTGHRDVSITAMRQAIQLEEGGSIPTTSLDRSKWRVRPISLDSARDMVRRHHYPRGGSNTAVYTFGVMPINTVLEHEAIAVSWWLPPTKNCGKSVWPDDPQAVLSLSRLVCVPGAPKNTPSFLLAHSQKQIDRRRWPIFITFADEWQGHVGTIYKAAGWIECGTTKPERTYRIDGRMVSRKCGPKTRTHGEMLSMGCEFVGSFRRRRFVHVRPDLKSRFEPICDRLRRAA